MLKRFMGTVDEDPIYHKRAAKNTPFETVQIRFPSQRPGMMNVPRTAADVVRLAQLGWLDFHPWPVRAEDIDHPDELRFDFDPTPGFDFEKVKEAAAGMKTLLEEVGLVGWPKTSGSRGIHVYVRIEPLWDFFQTRRAVLAAGRELERRMDGLVTTKWWKEERNGVFIDYNQNARDKSVCSAYGVRPTGYVSTPITWDELADVAIEDFPWIVCRQVWGGRRPHVGHRRVTGANRHIDGMGGPGSGERSRRRPVATDYPKMPDEPPGSSPPNSVAHRRTTKIPPPKGEVARRAVGGSPLPACGIPPCGENLQGVPFP